MTLHRFDRGLAALVGLQLAGLLACVAASAHDWQAEHAIMLIALVAGVASFRAAYQAVKRPLLHEPSTLGPLLLTTVGLGMGGMWLAFAAGPHLSSSIVLYTALLQSVLFVFIALKRNRDQ